MINIYLTSINNAYEHEAFGRRIFLIPRYYVDQQKASMKSTQKPVPEIYSQRGKYLLAGCKMVAVKSTKTLLGWKSLSLKGRTIYMRPNYILKSDNYY